MGGRVVAMRVGEVDLLVETADVIVAGSQPTSALGEASQQVQKGFDRAQQVIVEVASSVADTMGRLAKRGVHPDRVEVEFGLKFTLEGSVIVAGAAGEAALRVLVSYERAQQG